MPVWEDADDYMIRVDVASQNRLRKLRSTHGQTSLKGTAYEAALRKQHAALNPNTTWARGEGRGKSGGKRGAGEIREAEEPDEEAAEKLLRQAGGLLAGRGRGGLLGAGAIEMSRLRDANHNGGGEAVVQSLEWHPNAQLMMTAGLDKKLRLFQVGGGGWEGGSGCF